MWLTTLLQSKVWLTPPTKPYPAHTEVPPNCEFEVANFLSPLNTKRHLIAHLDSINHRILPLNILPSS